MSGREVTVLFTAAPGVIVWPGGAVQVEATVPSVALYTLAAVVEEAGFPCTVLDPVDYWRLCRTDDDLARTVEGHTVFCISANSTTWPTAVPIIRKVDRLRPRPLIVAGGLHPTVCDEHVMRSTGVDVIVRGEGELTLPALLKAHARGDSLEGVAGLTVRVGGGVVRTPDRPPLTSEELSVVPLPLWDRLPFGAYGFIPIETSRGCLFGCTFCSIYHKHLWRPQLTARVRDRIEHAVANLRLVTHGTLMFSDDCFTTDAGRIQALAEILATVAPGVGTGLEARAGDLLNPAIIDGLSRMKVDFVQVGVECGYPEGLRRVKKGVTLDQAIASVHALHRAGLRCQAKYSYIVGFPWESAADMKRTMAFAMGLGSRYANHVQVNWLLVVPGSEIYREFETACKISPADFDGLPAERPEMFARSHPTVDRKTAIEVQDYAAYLEQSYPWVTTLGNVFRFWTRHPHLPFDRITPTPIPGPGQVGAAPSPGEVCWKQMPDVLRTASPEV